MTKSITRISYTKNWSGKYILYWVQETQRTEYNFALEKSIQLSNHYKLPLVVFYNLETDYFDSNERLFNFLIQSLRDVSDNLKKRNIPFYFFKGDFIKNLKTISKDAHFLVWDKSYLKENRKLKENLANILKCNIYEVESNVLIPVETLSQKEEYSARTLRLKFNKLIDQFTNPFEYEEYTNTSTINLDIKDYSDSYFSDKKYYTTDSFVGGENTAQMYLDNFLNNNLKQYSKKGPDFESYSRLSPYLRIGNISPLDIFLKLKRIKSFKSDKEAFLEELLVRRELAVNFIYYNNNYDNWKGITYEWAYLTLDNHSKDKREYIYSLKDLESANTHDIYWNAAQMQMVNTGYMDGYMRMYWCKKILEWSKTPKIAYENAIYLNNKYFYDGNDPNSYTGVAWCFGKHDRAWKERDIFGKVRYMNASGLKRKFNMNIYINKYLPKEKG